MTDPRCVALTVIRAICGLLVTGRWIDGHDYREAEVVHRATVTVLRCNRCGKADIGWEKNDG